MDCDCYPEGYEEFYNKSLCEINERKLALKNHCWLTPTQEYEYALKRWHSVNCSLTAKEMEKERERKRAENGDS